MAEDYLRCCIYCGLCCVYVLVLVHLHLLAACEITIFVVCFSGSWPHRLSSALPSTYCCCHNPSGLFRRTNSTLPLPVFSFLHEGTGSRTLRSKSVLVPMQQRAFLPDHLHLCPFGTCRAYQGPCCVTAFQIVPRPILAGARALGLPLHLA